MFTRRFRSLFATPARFNPVEVAKKTRRKRQIALVAGIGIAIGTFDYKFRECLEVVGNPAGVQDPHSLFFARMLFGRLRSKLIGTLMEREVPVGMRASIYSAYAKFTGVDLDEMRYPIDSYRTVQEFFTRPLKKELRQMETVDPMCLVSPADSEVIACGDVLSDRLPQVKGTTYSLKGFLGVDPTKTLATTGKSAPVLKYIVLYLCPGDYHRFHSPTQFHVSHAKHFSGEVISVNKAALAVLNDVFSVNERVVLGGTWSQGNMWYTAVAAHGVGNIKLSFENKLRTNDPRTVPVYCGGDVRDRVFDQNLEFGEEVGMFKLGSTIVMVFEASKNTEWTVKEGDKVKIGQMLLRPAK
jgi:phosphatidylserine decarboxylase